MTWYNDSGDQHKPNYSNNENISRAGGANSKSYDELDNEFFIKVNKKILLHTKILKKLFQKEESNIFNKPSKFPPSEIS